jgi:putative phosphotransacetylase
MDETTLKRLIRNTVLTSMARRGLYYLPIAVSARHIHLSRADFETLFGKGKVMSRFRELSQPGQFAAEQTVDLLGPKGSFAKVRVLGPERMRSQVEISISDSFTLGVAPFIRMSGDIAGTPGCLLKGPAGTIELKEGVIAAARHVHMSLAQAAAYGVKDGDLVAVKTLPPREGIIGGIVVRCGEGHDLEVHLDTDEANGNGILCGTILEMAAGGTLQTGVLNELCPREALDLITERDINRALEHGEKTVYCAIKGFITPAAADRAKEKGIQICKLQG